MAVELNYQLKKFDMNVLNRPCTCLFLGACATGKTTLIKDLLYNNYCDYQSLVISGTSFGNEQYRDIALPELIHNKYNKNLIKYVIDFQKNCIRIKRDIKDVKPFFLILDDCLLDSKWTKDEEIDYMFRYGQCIKIYTLISQQYPSSLPPVIRENIDFLFILTSITLNTRRLIYDNYVGNIFPSFEVFCNVLDQCTDDYNCLVIHKSSQSEEIGDKVFWYKAEIRDWSIPKEIHKQVETLKELSRDFIIDNSINYQNQYIPDDIKDYINNKKMTTVKLLYKDFLNELVQ